MGNVLSLNFPALIKHLHSSSSNLWILDDVRKLVIMDKAFWTLLFVNIELFNFLLMYTNKSFCKEGTSRMNDIFEKSFVFVKKIIVYK